VNVYATFFATKAAVSQPVLPPVFGTVFANCFSMGNSAANNNASMVKTPLYLLGAKTPFCADRMTKYDSNVGIKILSNCSQTTQKLGLYVLPHPVYHVRSTALRIMNIVTDCRRYNWRCDGANCRERRCRKRSSGNSTFGSHWRCRCSGRERDSWCSQNAVILAWHDDSVLCG